MLRLILSFVLLVSLCFCKSADVFIKPGTDFKQFNRVGILTKPSADLTEADAQSIANEMVSIQLYKKNFQVVERFASKDIIKQLELNMTGLYNAEPEEMMKLKSVNSLLLVTFPRYKVMTFNQGGGRVEVLGTGLSSGQRQSAKTEVSVSVRLVAVNTGDVLYVCTSERQLQGSRLRDATKAVIDKCLADFPTL